jgi:hypothetical protein
MEKITLTRNDLYDNVWSAPLNELCEVFHVDRRGLEDIYYRLNVRYLRNGIRSKDSLAGKKSAQPARSPKSKGVETATLILPNASHWRSRHSEINHHENMIRSMPAIVLLLLLGIQVQDPQ